MVATVVLITSRNANVSHTDSMSHAKHTGLAQEGQQQACSCIYTTNVTMLKAGST